MSYVGTGIWPGKVTGSGVGMMWVGVGVGGGWGGVRINSYPVLIGVH